MRPDWWKPFFTPANFPITELSLSRSTRQEAAALLRLLRLPRGARVLDLCCGVGRHSVLLAKAGLRVTGFDQSGSYLAAARRAARKKGLEAEFVRGDMRRLPFEGAFDAVVNLWTSFGYFPRLEDDRGALRGMLRSLKPGGRLVLEMVDGRRLLSGLPLKDWNREGRLWCLESHRLRRGADPAVFSERIFIGPDRAPRGGETFTRVYTRGRLEAELRRAGFVRIRILAGLIEPWAPLSRRRRILALAERERGES